MKTAKERPQVGLQPARPKRQPDHRVFRTQVAEGDVIRFDPSGEQLRVMKIENDRITFEKIP
ncbi:MAG TPA: hypothetical protein VKB51_18280 [bacterium]|nr:hypothetical protein [bacterium]